MNPRHYRIESEPNSAQDGYLHVSTAGPFRSTLKYPGSKADERGRVSARQRRKIRKATARANRSAQPAS